jgi:hypothetical protein
MEQMLAFRSLQLFCHNPPFWCWREGFYRCAPGFHANVARPFQHPAADVSGDRDDGWVCRPALRKGRNGAVAEILEPEAGQSDHSGAETALVFERFWGKGRTCFGEAGEGDDGTTESSALVGADCS